MQRLYESEINFVISSFYDDDFYVKLGDEMNGFRADGRCATWGDVEEWLDHPTSAFAAGQSVE